MKVLDTRKGEALRAADACREKQCKQVAEERVSERSVWESIDRFYQNSAGHTESFLGRFPVYSTYTMKHGKLSRGRILLLLRPF
jgi:hypothetical protein